MSKVRRYLFIISACLSLAHAFGQIADSTSRQNVEELKAYQSKLDSIATRFNQRIDSIQFKSAAALNIDFDNMSRRLQGLKRRIDSTKTQRKLDAIKGNLRRRMDSLSVLNVPG